MAAAALGMSSCNDWLDVNTNPNTPTNEFASYYQRLPHCEFYMNDAQVFAGFRNSGTVGDMTAYSGRTYTTDFSDWNFKGSASPTSGLWSAVTTCYQWFFVGCGANLDELYNSAMAAEAYHYAGAAKLIHAYGFMLMTDLHGEMPYDEALSEPNVPTYNTGKEIYAGCLKNIDQAIELLSKPQGPNAKPLSEGDYWAHGDSKKWLKMAYLFKARWLNKLIKKGAGKCVKDDKGNYTTLKWDADLILDCLDHAQLSKDDDVIINHTDENSKSHDVLGWDEPVDYHGLYSVLGMNSNYWFTKTVYDNLTNFDGTGVEDPRADHILPWAWNNGDAASNAALAAKGVKFTGNWRRTLGVDLQDEDARMSGCPVSTSFDTDGGFFWCNTANESRKGDTIYVQTTSSSKGYAANKDLIYRRAKNYDNSAMSGSFFSRVSAPGYVATYAEACFIRAEVLLKTGKPGAFEAYKAGTRAAIEQMNAKLNVWVGEDESLKSCPSFTPMAQADIDDYVNNHLGTEADLTIAKILTQKRLAMMYHMEVYNDMRRYDYTDCCLNWEKPVVFRKNLRSNYDYLPADACPRRWPQCSHEFNYNKVNLQAIGAKVPGAEKLATFSTSWNTDKQIASVPVWWDSTQE